MKTHDSPGSGQAVPKFMRIAARHKAAIEKLSSYEAGELFQQALRFTVGEPLKEFVYDRAEVAFDFLKPDLEADIARQQAISRARREAGKRGGEAKSKSQGRG